VAARSVGSFVVDICGEMTWPAVTAEIAELGWKLRYARNLISREDEFVLASIVDAYLTMVQDPIRKRNAVCREIVQASRAARQTQEERP
jgi:hypothetical protein